MSLWKSIIYPPVHVKEESLKACFSGKWVVVTGASRGIGEALTRRLMAVGANLYLIARSEEALKQLCYEAHCMGYKAYYSAIDLRQRDALEDLCRQLKVQLPTVDFFFCNAGKSICRRINESLERLHDFDRTMDLNYRSLVALSLSMLPAMQKAGGRLIYTSSVSTLYPPAPAWAAYHSSKCAANVWCKTAAVELKKMSVKVQVAYLPLVRTEMSDANKRYQHFPAYTPKEAADLLLRLSLQRRFAYKPWWARASQPIAAFLSPVIRWIYSLIG